jgi:hypothetical protein
MNKGRKQYLSRLLQYCARLVLGTPEHRSQVRILPGVPYPPFENREGQFCSGAQASFPRRDPRKAGKLSRAQEFLPVAGHGGRDDVPVAGREALKLKAKDLTERFAFAWKAGKVFERQREAA